MLQATEELARELMRISKATRMSEKGIMEIYGFLWQREEVAATRAQQESVMEKERAQMEADQAAHLDLPVQEIIGNE